MLLFKLFAKTMAWIMGDLFIEWSSLKSSWFWVFLGDQKEHFSSSSVRPRCMKGEPKRSTERSQLCERDSRMSAWKAAFFCSPCWVGNVVKGIINIWNKLPGKAVGGENRWNTSTCFWRNIMDDYCEKQEVCLSLYGYFSFAHLLHFYYFNLLLHFTYFQTSVLRNSLPKSHCSFTNNFFSTLSSTRPRKFGLGESRTIYCNLL